MINFATSGTGIKELTGDDPLFTITGQFTITNRAGLKISNRCPENYRSLIAECVQHGWIKPVAYVTDEEYMVMQLSN